MSLHFNYHELLFLCLLLISPLLTETDNDIKDLNHFVSELFYKLISTKPNHDLVITPLSLVLLLIIIRMKGTLTVSYEFDKTFGLVGLSDGAITQGFANLLEKYKHPEYIDIKNTIQFLSEGYVVYTLVLDAKANVHAWSVYDICNRSHEFSTEGKATELVLTTETDFHNLLLKYSTDSKTSGSFHNIENVIENVEVIQVLGNLKYGEMPGLKSHVVEVPYNDEDTSLLIILPNEKDGISDLENNLDAYNLTDILESTREEQIKLILPKFKVNFNMELQEDLKILGLKNMFEHLCESSIDIRVSKIIYKASFKTDAPKNFTDDLKFADNLTPIEHFQAVEVDHPFIFIIKSSENVIYLMGRILKYPEGEMIQHNS
ncbi:serpin I2-like [Cochliomyia hominivorax]